MTSTSGHFFLVGALRSGTTVTRLMLGHHPLIGPCEEIEYLLPILVGRRDWPTIEEFQQRLRSGRDPHSLLCLATHDLPSGIDFPALAEWLLRRSAQDDGRRLCGATVHHHFDELPRLWPSARYIHLVRDPRDVVRSCVGMGWAGNAWGALPIWREERAAWERLCRHVDPSQRLELRYEDLVADPVGEMTRVVRFLGLEFDPRMLEIDRDTSYRAPTPVLARSWSIDAPVREVQIIEAELGDALTAAGYARSPYPPLSLSPGDRFRLAWADRWGRARFSQTRYGVALWAMAALSRRVPSIALQHWVATRVDAINRHHRK